MKENSLKDIKFIEEEDFLKSIDLKPLKKDFQTLNMIGNEITVNYGDIPV